MKTEEFKGIFKRMKSDFKPGEYAPYGVLYKQLEEGAQSGMILCRDGEDLGYAICADSSDNNYVLLSYLAIYKDFRGLGLGLELLEKVKERYKNKEGIIVEVEKPENAKTQQEKTTCEKRISFYAKAGYKLVPNIEYSIWDTPMHLMALPCRTPFESMCRNFGDVINGIYLDIMGERFMHKLVFKNTQHMEA